MTPPKTSTDEAFETAAQVISRKWCLNPKPVEQALRKLHKKPSHAFRMAITMGDEEFTSLVMQGVEIEDKNRH